MDTSKEYIKMCTKAKEIQKIEVKIDDIFYFPSIGRIAHGYDIDIVGISPPRIWLPRQDQLQEMATIPPESTLHEVLDDFIDYNWKYVDLKWSMEKLWLTCVMKQKYHKIWNGEDWVEERL